MPLTVVPPYGTVKSAIGPTNEDRVTDMPLEDVRVYVHGLVYASVCAAADVPAEKVAATVNVTHPTGIAPQWHIASEPFADGSPNPNPCEQDGSRVHWLLSC